MADVGPVSTLTERAVLLSTDWLYIDDGSGGDKSVRLAGVAAAMGLAAALATGQALAQGLTTTSPGFYAQITGDAVPRVRVGVNANDAGSIAFGSGAATRDLFLERAGAATLRIGNADAAAPVAQTVGVQNVVAGTSNTAGVAFTINGSQGTGTGVGGSIVFKVAPAGSTGTSVNALTTALTIDSTKLVSVATALSIGGATPGSNALAVTGTGNFSGNITTAGYFLASTQGTNGGVHFGASGTYVTSPSDGKLVFWNNSQTDFSRLQFGGTTSAFPAIGRSGAALVIQVGDGTLQTGFASIAAANLRQGFEPSATPIAQIFTFGEASRGGTDTNVAGANGTLQSGAGTGSGTGSSLIFQTPTTGTTGTTAQTYATRLTLTDVFAKVASGVQFWVGNSATTGLAAGVLAATTNATIVIYDSAGQAYRVPCII